MIAGYHWFTDWGRDTMISMEGLTLCTGRHQEARSILRTFANYAIYRFVFLRGYAISSRLLAGYLGQAIGLYQAGQGAGFIGSHLCERLLGEGHRVIGVDVDDSKLALIRAGKTPVVEEGMVELMAKVVASGNVAVTTDDASPGRLTRIAVVEPPYCAP